MDTTAASNQQKQNSQNSIQSQLTQISHQPGGKETEPVRLTAELQTVPAEVEIPLEVERVGVKSTDKLEIPPDLKKLGVTSVPSATAASSVALPAVALPLSDTKILFGLHSSVYS